MEFQVPQFISREMPIAGPLTFSQFTIVAIAGFLIVVLFFLMRTYIFYFVIAASVIAGIAFAFAFIQTNGQTLATLLKNAFFHYFFKPRVYVWRKKGMSPPIIRSGEQKIQISQLQEEEKPKFKLIPESQVKKLQKELETREKW